MYRDYLQQFKEASPLTQKMPSFDGNPASVAPSVQDSSSILSPSCTVLRLIVNNLQASVAPVARFFSYRPDCAQYDKASDEAWW